MALDSVTEEIRRRADLVEIVGQYVALRPAGTDRWKACCPFHDEKTPSFYVSRDKGFYKCFGCGKSGNCFQFLMELENMTFPEAKKALAERYGIKIPERRDLTDEQKKELSERERLLKVAASAQKFFAEQLAGNGGLIARDYARKRGLSRATVEKFGLGYAPDAWDGLRNALTRRHGFSDDDGILAGLFIERKSADADAGGLFAEGARRRVYDRYRHRLMFPIWDEAGRVIAFGGRALDGGQTANSDAKYINSPETPLFHKSNILFAWHLARPEVSKKGGVVVTEGYMDAIAMHEGGFPNTVATLGTALTAQHVALIRRMSPEAVWLCFDGDSAGMRAALRTAPLFSEAGLNVRVVRLPVEHDPDTYIREFGQQGMQDALREAVPLARYRLETVVEGKNWDDLSERSAAMREAAEIINDIRDTIEREGYINFLVDKYLSVQHLSSRAEWERARAGAEALVKAELSADSQRQGAAQRLRETKYNQPRPHINPQATAAPQSEQGTPPMREVPAHSLQDIAEETNIGRQKVQTPQGTFRPRFVSPKQQEREQQAAKDATDLRESTEAILAQKASTGGLKAEKELIGALLGHPVWRETILQQLTLEKWTNEIHGEIVIRIRNWGQNEGEDEHIEPMRFNEGLSEAAQSVVAEIMLSENSGDLPDAAIIQSWIDRVKLHWARQAEREMLEMVPRKLDRGEPVSSAELAAFHAALAATNRKAPLEKK